MENLYDRQRFNVDMFQSAMLQDLSYIRVLMEKTSDKSNPDRQICIMRFSWQRNGDADEKCMVLHTDAKTWKLIGKELQRKLIYPPKYRAVPRGEALEILGIWDRLSSASNSGETK